MTTLTPEMREAFDRLGVSPDAGQAEIRSAWRAMVRAYHPDQVKDDKAEANRRLAEMNAAFDLVSTWTPADARLYARACRQGQGQSGKHAAQEQEAKAAAARKAQAKRAAAQVAREAQAARAAQAQERARAASAAARRNAAALERKEAAQRAARPRLTPAELRAAEMARAGFLQALCQLVPLSTPSVSLRA